MALTPLQQVRLLIGDTEEPFFLTDDQINFYLSENNDNIPLTVSQLRPALAIVMSSTLAREREGQVEVYQGDRARNYLEALRYLDDTNRNLPIGTSIRTLGVTKTFNRAVRDNSNSVGAGVSVGMFSGNSENLFDGILSEDY